MSMTVRERIIKLLGGQLQQKAQDIPFRFDIAGGRIIAPADNKQAYIINGYNVNDVIYSVINLILDKVRLPDWSLNKVVDENKLRQFRMMMKTRDISTRDYKKALHLKDQALEPITSPNLQQGKLTDLLKYPNDLETFEDFITYGCLFKMITGDSYIWGDVLGGGANKGIPNTLWNLPAQHVTIQITDQFPARPAAYNLFAWGQKFAPELILHEIYSNPNWNINGEQLYGFSPLRAFLRNTTRNNYAKEASIAKFQNGGMEELIFVNDPRFTAEEGKAQAEAVKKILMSPEYRGAGVQGKIAVSGIPMNHVALGRDPVQLGIIDSERWDAVMFCNGYGVPSELLGLTSKTFNNIKEGEKALTLRSAIPLLTSKRNSLNRKILSDWGFKGQNIYIDYNTECFPELQSDQSDTSNWLQTLIMMTPDEQREYLGVDSLNTPESQEVWVKTNTGYVPLSDFQQTATDQQLQDLVNATMASNGQQANVAANGNGQAPARSNGAAKPKPAAAN